MVVGLCATFSHRWLPTRDVYVGGGGGGCGLLGGKTNGASE